MNARLRRIAADYEEIKKNFSGHKNIVVEPIGPEPAEKYRVTYYVNGIYLIGQNVETLNKHVVIITLHSDYPRYKPLCTIATPIWHPNFKDGQICIGDIWGAGESLSDIIVNIGDMIQYKSWNSFSPLCAEAAKWAIKHKDMFPVGNIDLWTGEEVSENNLSDLDIKIFDDDNEQEKTDDKQVQDNVQLKVNDEQEQENNQQNEQIDKDNLQENNSVEGDSSEDISERVAAELEQKMSEDQGGLDDEYEDMSQSPEETFKEFDFEITAEELKGIEFIPAAVKMQGNQLNPTEGSKKINFKTVFMKGILYGLIGGIIGWVFQEFQPITDDTLLAWKGYTEDSLYKAVISGSISEARFYSILSSVTFNSSAIFSACIGSGVGAVMGIGEGLYYGSKKNALKYGLIGLGISLGIGFIGGYIAQAVYSLMVNDLDEYASIIYQAFGRAFGWAVLGLGVGTAIGLIKPDATRIRNCIIGGSIGGFLGGFIFDFIPEVNTVVGTDGAIISRAIGIIIMGILIGLSIGLLEQFAKSAWLKVIRGDFEGKEYLIFKGTTTIGNNGNNVISLFKDKLVAPEHCEIMQEGNRYVIVDKGSPTGTFVNGMRVTRHTLNQGDTVAVGNSVMVFNTK